LLGPRTVVGRSKGVAIEQTGAEGPTHSPLAEFPETAAEQALWWEGHILEMPHGLPPRASDEAVTRPEFAPRQHSLAERERAKAAELTAAGHKVTASGSRCGTIVDVFMADAQDMPDERPRPVRAHGWGPGPVRSAGRNTGQAWWIRGVRAQVPVQQDTGVGNGDRLV
jgi:hypothetical protein